MRRFACLGIFLLLYQASASDSEEAYTNAYLTGAWFEDEVSKGDDTHTGDYLVRPTLLGKRPPPYTSYDGPPPKASAPAPKAKRVSAALFSTAQAAKTTRPATLSPLETLQFRQTTRASASPFLGVPSTLFPSPAAFMPITPEDTHRDHHTQSVPSLDAGPQDKKPNGNWGHNPQQRFPSGSATALVPEIFKDSLFPNVFRAFKGYVPDNTIAKIQLNNQAFQLPLEIICAIAEYTDQRTYLRMMCLNKSFARLLRERYPARFGRFMDSLFDHPYLQALSQEASNCLSATPLSLKQYCCYIALTKECPEHVIKISTLFRRPAALLGCLEFAHRSKSPTRFFPDARRDDIDYCLPYMDHKGFIVPETKHDKALSTLQEALRGLYHVYMRTMQRTRDAHRTFGSMASSVAQMCNDNPSATGSGSASTDRPRWQQLYLVERTLADTLGCATTTRPVNYTLLDALFADYIAGVVQHHSKGACDHVRQPCRLLNQFLTCKIARYRSNYTCRVLSNPLAQIGNGDNLETAAQSLTRFLVPRLQKASEGEPLSLWQIVAVLCGEAPIGSLFATH